MPICHSITLLLKNLQYNIFTTEGNVMAPFFIITAFWSLLSLLSRSHGKVPTFTAFTSYLTLNPIIFTAPLPNPKFASLLTNQSTPAPTPLLFLL